MLLKQLYFVLGTLVFVLVGAASTARAYERTESKEFWLGTVACERLARDRSRGDDDRGDNNRAERLARAAACLMPMVSQAKKPKTKAELDYRLAEWLEQGERPEQARAAFLSVAKFYPRERIAARARFRAARILEDALDREDDAISEYERLVREAPDSTGAVNALVHLDEILMRRGQSQRLDELLAGELRARPASELAPLLMRKLGSRLLAMPASQKLAARVFDELARRPGSGQDDALYHGARAQLALGDPKAAIERLETLCAMHERSLLPGGSSVLLDDGRLLIAEIYRDRIGDKKRARHHFERLVEDFPESRLVDDALVALAALDLAEGDRRGARHHYQQLLSMRPTSRFAAQAKQFAP